MGTVTALAAAGDENFANNVQVSGSVTGWPNNTVYPYNQQIYTTSYPVYVPAPTSDLERFRLALELIAEGKLTKADLAEIAKTALRKQD